MCRRFYYQLIIETFVIVCNLLRNKKVFIVGYLELTFSNENLRLVNKK